MTVITYREKRTRELMRLMGFLLGFLLLAVLLLAWQLPSPTVSHHKKKFLLNPGPSLRLKSRKRIAIIIPFVARGPENIPPYLSVFCVGAAGVKDVADFLIFHNGVLDEPSSSSSSSSFFQGKCPSNVKFISLESTDNMAQLLLKVVDHKHEDELAVDMSLQRLTQLVSHNILAYPYSLVEFKPAYGYIFQDYLEGYSHWGYSDVDMLFGDLGRWIEPEELHDFDIVTYGYGDQNRIYLRGQFTFHKNEERINLFWRDCGYLSDMDQRLADVVHGKKKYHFESAEGCYSAAILKQKDVSVKYAVKAWTDVHQDDTAATHGLYFSRNVEKGRGVIYKAVNAKSGKALLNLTSKWFEKDNVYRDRNQPLQKPVGELLEIDLPNDHDANCMYWVQSKYQRSLCLSKTVSSHENLYWLNGKLYKRAFVLTELETNVQTGPFFHFQEWKRYYRPSQLASLHVLSPVSTFVLAKEGAIPLLDPSKHSSYSSPVIPPPLRLSPMHWKPASVNVQSLLPRESYCLLSGPKKSPPKPPAPDCYYQVSWQDEAGIEILAGGAPGWSTVHVELDVTLVMTLQLTETQAKSKQSLSDMLEILVENLERWQGQPCVVVIHVAGVTEEAIEFIRQLFDVSSNSASQQLHGIDNALIAVVYQEEDNAVSRKALLNMATDAVPTRWYVSGIELERGLVLSVDAVYFAHRAARMHSQQSGHVFVIPQFAYVGEGGSSSLSLGELKAASSVRDKVKAPCEVEKACDSDTVERLDKTDVLWWAQVENFLSAETTVGLDLTKKAEWIQAMELGFLEYLTDEHHLKMFAMDESPILLTDNIGPRPGMRTDELAREIEQLGGRRCYNGLRLAQLAAFGYKFDALGGAFAISTEKTRGASAWGVDDSLAGTSRCDGCFMFAEQHEDILEDIIKDEIRRAGKASVLWAEMYDDEES